MAQYDLPLERLREHRSATPVPTDFDEFWRDTLTLASSHELNPVARGVDVGLTGVDVVDLTFAGWDGTPVAGWLYLPRDRPGPLPAVVEYVGYTGGRGHPLQHLVWSALGYVHLVVDTRGQGTSPSSVGVTADDAGPVGPHAPGFLTMGVESRERYYYRRVFADAARAVQVVREHDAVDPARVLVTGASQGGGIALAVAGLVDGLAGVAPDVPFLCDMRRASEITDARPYFELGQYCRAHRDRIDDVFATLAYFDGACHATRATAPALFSVALMDETCPPSTVFAAHNAYAGPHTIEVYPYNGHEGGGAFQVAAQARFFAERTATVTA